MDHRRRRVLVACGAAAFGLAGCLGDNAGEPTASTRRRTPADETDTTSQSPPGGPTTSPDEPPTNDRTPAGPARTRWHVPTEGTPQRPLVADGTCYLGTGKRYDQDEPDDAALLAVDESGTVLWREHTGQPYVRVVAVSDGVAYAISGDTQGPHGEDYRLHAFDATSGKRHWVWAPQLSYKFFEFLGVRNGTAFVGTHDDALEGAGESVHAIADGAADWRQSTGDVMGGTLVGDTVVVDHAGGIDAVAAGDGTERWTYDVEDYGGNEVTGFGDRVLVRDDGLHALDAREGSERWTIDDWTVTNWHVESDTAYAGGERVVALDRSGSPRWTYEAGGLPTAVGTDDSIVGVSTHELFILDRPTGEERWRVDVDTEMPSPGGIVNGRLAYGTREGGVVAVDAATGDAAWSWRSNAGLVTPAVAGQTLVVGRADGGLWGLAP
ncbi:MAG: PQQ-binding-like beta-propeller repeat protein [Haloarculaceae archaeon]